MVRDKVGQWPPEFGDLLAYQFWTSHEGQPLRIMGEPEPRGNEPFGEQLHSEVSRSATLIIGDEDDVMGPLVPRRWANGNVRMERQYR